jgi:hypothetical protein
MEHTTDKRQLRSFGLIVGGIFTILSLWPRVFRHQDIRVWALILGALLILPAIALPQVLKWPHYIWMRIGHVLGWINSRIIMTIAFYAVFTPVGFIRRFNSDPMNRKFEPESPTYRVKRERRDPSHMTHQF